MNTAIFYIDLIAVFKRSRDILNCFVSCSLVEPDKVYATVEILLPLAPCFGVHMIQQLDTMFKLLCFITILYQIKQEKNWLCSRITDFTSLVGDSEMVSSR